MELEQEVVYIQIGIINLDLLVFFKLMKINLLFQQVDLEMLHIFKL